VKKSCQVNAADLDKNFPSIFLPIIHNSLHCEVLGDVRPFVPFHVCELGMVGEWYNNFTRREQGPNQPHASSILLHEQPDFIAEPSVKIFCFL
jgi:hypothetical protein